MSDQDAFAGTDTETPNLDVKFDDLVGDGKRYKTTDDAAKALVHKDQFIEQLKREKAEVLASLSQRIKEEDFLKKLEEVTTPKLPEQRDPPVERGNEPDKSAVKPEDVERIIEQREAKTKREANLQAVTDRLQETFGAEFKARVQSQAKAMGETTAYLTDLAARNPQMFYQLMGMNQPRREDAFSAPPRSSVNTDSRPVSGMKDYNHFARLRKEKGDHWYFSTPVQQEIWRASQEAAKRGIPFLPE